MKLQERITNDPYELTEKFMVEGAYVRQYNNSSNITLFDFSDLGKLIIGPDVNIRTQLQRIYDKISDEFKAVVNVRYENNKILQQRMLSDSGLYAFILMIDNDDIQSIKDRFYNAISSFARQNGYRPEEMLRISKDRENILNIDWEPEKVLARFRDYLKKIIKEYSVKDIIFKDVYTFPALGDDPVTSEESRYYIENIEKVNIENRVTYFVGRDIFLHGLVNEFGLDILDANNLINQYFDILVAGSKLYIDPRQIKLLVEDISLGHITYLIQYKGQNTLKLLARIIQSMFEERELASILAKSVSLYKNVTCNYESVIYSKFHERVYNLTSKGNGFVKSINIVKEGLLKEYGYYPIKK